MAEIFSLSLLPLEQIHQSKCHTFNSFISLVATLFLKGNSNTDIDHATLIVLTDTIVDGFDIADQALFLKYFFSHFNLLVVVDSLLSLSDRIASLNTSIDTVTDMVNQRITRVQLWTGTGSPVVNDRFLPPAHIDKEVVDALGTMSFVLNHVSNKSSETDDCIRNLTRSIISRIDFLLLLSCNHPQRLATLCNLVGHWSFPAHELNNDDLVYCAYVMLEFALTYAMDSGLLLRVNAPSSNDLLAFVFIVRDTYQHGNPFHNFRHAVDVLQACFHFLVRLKCLPTFTQYSENPKADEISFLEGEAGVDGNSDILLTKTATSSSEHNNALLNPLQTFGLLLAAIGHDVGHPGVTNAFLINHLSFTSQVFSERSVLELFHATVFTNKILRICLPDFLNLPTEANDTLVMRNLITESILATDMAEHFEYIHKLQEFSIENSQPSEDRVKLISSLLIKCADISNVTRPLRVSSQWAQVLSREFEEVETLERKLSKNESVQLDVSYPDVPLTLDGVLELSPEIHKGQIFFIKTFAEGLFNSILELFPELKYTSDIVEENKAYWLERSNTYEEAKKQ